MDVTFADDTPVMRYTAFHWACRNGHLSLVKWFVEVRKGLILTTVPKGQQSAMTQAVINGHRHILSYLFRKRGLTDFERWNR